MTNILLTTTGISWQIVPELFGFTNPDSFGLYRHHPQAARMQEVRRAYQVAPAEEIWAVGTGSVSTQRAFSAILKWQHLLPEPSRPVIRLWQVAGVDDLASEEECLLMREAIFRLVAKARQTVGKGQLVLSLAGGRKTMSSDMQRAAAFWGCHCLVHVTEDSELAKKGRPLAPDDLARPLPRDTARAYTPLIAGTYPPSALVFLKKGGRTVADPALFPAEKPKNGEIASLSIADASLVETIATCEQNAGYLVTNYTNQLMQGEPATNFLALYHLSPEVIDQLKSVRIGADPSRSEKEKKWLEKLPKTDLHCHLGGTADAEQIIRIAETYRPEIDRYRVPMKLCLEKWRREVAALNADGNREPVDFRQVRTASAEVPAHILTAAFVLEFGTSPEALDRLVFGRHLQEPGFCNIGFDPYEALGDIQGSGLLQGAEAIRQACRGLAEKARKDNVKYLEVRCSPANYAMAGLAPEDVVHLIDETFSEVTGLEYGILLIASRHGKMSRVYEHIELVQKLLEEKQDVAGRLLGFDLAGREEARNPAVMRQAFLPLMEKCFHFTIHAGEKSQVTSIWEAVYHLNAERIGHGLTLKNNPVLMDRFKDRRIAIEMCPSSNFQIVGFADNYLPATNSMPTYPLKDYLDAGLAVSINTDNPGISRTDWTREIHKAARMTPGGLSLWDVLLLVKNGFKTAFVSKKKRQELLLEAEKEIVRTVQKGFPGL